MRDTPSLVYPEVRDWVGSKIHRRCGGRKRARLVSDEWAQQSLGQIQAHGRRGYGLGSSIALSTAIISGVSFG